MVKHGALSKSHVQQLLRSKDARVRRAAFTLLEMSNPTRFIWDANPSYDVYQEFTKRHFQGRYKVHELIAARLKIEKQKKLSAAADHLTDNTRHLVNHTVPLLSPPRRIAVGVYGLSASEMTSRGQRLRYLPQRLPLAV